MPQSPRLRADALFTPLVNSRFACLFGDCALVNTILGVQPLLYCPPPPLRFAINIAQYMVHPRPPCVSIQHTILAILLLCTGQMPTGLIQHTILAIAISCRGCANQYSRCHRVAACVLNRYSRIPVAQAIWIRIAYSAQFTLLMTRIRTYSRFMYSQNRLNMTRIPCYFPRSAYSTWRVAAYVPRVNPLPCYPPHLNAMLLHYPTFRMNDVLTRPVLTMPQGRRLRADALFTPDCSRLPLLGLRRLLRARRLGRTRTLGRSVLSLEVSIDT